MSGRSIKGLRKGCYINRPAKRAGINLTPPPYSPLVAGLKRRGIDRSAVEILALI